MKQCQYKQSLGVPNKGFHSHLFGVAILDYLATLLIAYCSVHLIGVQKTKMNFLSSFLLWFCLGEFLHYKYCVDTTMQQSIRNL